MYRALYRKYRPLTFDDVIGQNDIVTALTSQVANQKTGHAYIFTGTRGTGKTTCAKIFAKAINCTDTKNGNPCGECAICKGVENGSLVDVVEIDAASNNGVDSIRDLREETAYTPSVAKYKVYIIDEVHMLSTAAFNALLKIMEEPPAHIVFILATTEIHKVPATILSRCQRYDFMRISPTEINARLCHVATEENIELTKEAANLISRLADGAMRDALSILDTCSSTGGVIDEIMVQKMAGVTDKSYLFKLSDAIAKRDAAAAICLLADIRTGCSDTKRIIEELIFHYRNLLLSKLGAENIAENVSEDDLKKYKTSSENISANDCIFAIRRLGDSLERMSKGGDQRIELELCMVDLTTPVTVQAVPISPAYAQTAVPSQSVKAASQKASISSQSTANAAQNSQPPQKDGKALPPLEVWDTLVESFKEKDRALHSFLKKSKAYIEGKRVLIDAGPLFTSYIRQTDSVKDLIKKSIFEATGVDYSIGPYTPPETTAEPKEDEALKKLRDLGVDVIEK